MNRKAFRCGVLALLLVSAAALPAVAAAPGSRSSRPAVERGVFQRAVDLVAGLFIHLTGANRGGIDPNGLPNQDPALKSPTALPTDPGDNRGGIDPNG